GESGVLIVVDIQEVIGNTLAIKIWSNGVVPIRAAHNSANENNKLQAQYEQAKLREFMGPHPCHCGKCVNALANSNPEPTPTPTMTAYGNSESVHISIQATPRRRTDVASRNQSTSHLAHQAGQRAVRIRGGVDREVFNTCVTLVVNHVVVPTTRDATLFKLKVKDKQEKDKIGSKLDKNEKRGKAENSQKQLQSRKQEKRKKIQI
nr:hypothetical protein [Tanacetum cinerariifolium]